MDLIIALVLGLLIGWLGEWIIDWLFWRKSNEAQPAKDTAPQKQENNLEEELLAEIADLRLKLASTSNATGDSDELKKLRDKLAAAESMITALASQVANAQKTEIRSDALLADMQMMSAQANVSQALQVQLTAARNEIDGLRARVADAEMWRNKTLAAEAELNTLKSESTVTPSAPAETSDGSNAVINDLIAKLAASEERSARLPVAEAMLASLSVQLDEAYQWRKRFEDSDEAFNKLWKEMGDDKQRLYQLEEEVKRVRQSAPESPVANVNEYEDEMAQLTAELDESKQRLKQLSEYEFEYNHLKAELSELDYQRSRVNDLDDELGFATTELENAKQKLARLNDLEAEVNLLRAAQVAAVDEERHRARVTELENEIAQLRSIETDYEAQHRRIIELESQIERLRPRIADLESELSRLRAEAAKPAPIVDAPPKEVEQEDMELISGIGPVFAKRLRLAGIKSYSDIARLTPAKLREIVAVKKWQRLDAASWIAQAIELSGEHLQHEKKKK